LAPVFSFLPYTSRQQNTILAGGNFYGVIPYEGRYDALLPTSLQSGPGNTMRISDVMPEVEGEVRDLKWIQTSGGKKVMIMARNNAPLLFFKRRD
jgi:hypothetical protein